MQVTVSSANPTQARTDVLAIPFFQLDGEKWRLPARWTGLDEATGGQLASALRSGDFRGRPGETLRLYPTGGVGAGKIVLVGLGEEAGVDAEALRRAAGTSLQAAPRAGSLALAAPATRRLRPDAVARALTEGLVLAGYRFDDFKEEDPKDAAPLPESATLFFERAPAARSARRAVQVGTIVAESQNVARDLSNLPGNELPPASLAQRAQKLARAVGLTCRVLDPAELKRRKMEAILAVGAGSAHPPRVIVLEHNAPPRGKPAGRRRRTVCLVGKGVTFDSGGISIKPSAGMGDMKHDMSGAAAVVGAMRAAALLKVPQHVVGLIGAAENMPSGSAYRPGDVVRSMSGKSIEVLNTDAEGRVVLADVLHYARTTYEPDAMVDLATLTGACVVALGPWCSGLMGTDDDLVERLRRAGETSGERLWPLPLWDEHRSFVKGRVGDVKNTAGREAGAITAGAFLSHFAGETPWAHLDIAGTAWTEKPGPYQPFGATGVGVRLLLEWLQGAGRTRGGAV